MCGGLESDEAHKNYPICPHLEGQALLQARWHFMYDAMERYVTAGGQLGPAPTASPSAQRSMAGRDETRSRDLGTIDAASYCSAIAAQRLNLTAVQLRAVLQPIP